MIALSPDVSGCSKLSIISSILTLRSYAISLPLQYNNVNCLPTRKTIKQLPVGGKLAGKSSIHGDVVCHELVRESGVFVPAGDGADTRSPRDVVPAQQLAVQRVAAVTGCVLLDNVLDFTEVLLRSVMHDATSQRNHCTNPRYSSVGRPILM
jgi:hypothetical protein